MRDKEKEKERQNARRQKNNNMWKDTGYSSGDSGKKSNYKDKTKKKPFRRHSDNYEDD